jgi:hypothetical protein
LSSKDARAGLILAASAAFLAVACLLLWRLPDGVPALPAVRPALALSIAWLFAWPYQRCWYDAMMLCLLALFPASRLDWPVLALLAAGTFYAMPGMPGALPRGALRLIGYEEKAVILPAVRLLAVMALIALCLTAGWHRRPGAGPPATPPGPLRPARSGNGQSGRSPVRGRAGASGSAGRAAGRYAGSAGPAWARP